MGVNNSTGADLTSKNTSGSYNTYNINAGTFTVKTTGTNSPAEALRIDGNGRLGIGDNSPSVKVSIKDANPKIKFIDSDASGTPETLLDGSGGDLILDVDKDNEKGSTLFAVNLDGSEKLRIETDGELRLTSENGNNNDTPGIKFRGGSSSQKANFARIHSRMVSNWGGELQFKVKDDDGNLADNYQTVMKMDSNGRVTKPLTPAFAATGSGSYYTLANQGDFPFTNERFDVTNNYNTSNSRFTCPVDGRYLFWVTLFLYGTQPSGENRVYFKLNGSNFYNGQVVRNTNTYECLALTVVGDLDANDYVTVGSWQNISGTQVYRGHCNFGGYLLG